jgi:hypothetical protein
MLCSSWASVNIYKTAWCHTPEVTTVKTSNLVESKITSSWFTIISSSRNWYISTESVLQLFLHPHSIILKWRAWYILHKLSSCGFICLTTCKCNTSLITALFIYQHGFTSLLPPALLWCHILLPTNDHSLVAPAVWVLHTDHVRPHIQICNRVKDNQGHHFYVSNSQNIVYR